MWPITGDTRKPEHVPQQQPIQRQKQPQKHMVHVAVHASMKPPELEVPIEAQMPDKALDQVEHPSTPEDPVEQETEVSEPLPGTYSASTTKTNGSRTTITSNFTCANPMPLPDTLPKVPDQPIP